MISFWFTSFFANPLLLEKMEWAGCGTEDLGSSLRALPLCDLPIITGRVRTRNYFLWSYDALSKICLVNILPASWEVRYYRWVQSALEWAITCVIFKIAVKMNSQKISEEAAVGRATLPKYIQWYDLDFVA